MLVLEERNRGLASGFHRSAKRLGLNKGLNSCSDRLDFIKIQCTLMNCDAKRVFSCVKSFFICGIVKVTTLKFWYRGKHIIWSIARRKEKAGKFHRLSKVTRAASVSKIDTRTCSFID